MSPGKKNRYYIPPDPVVRQFDMRLVKPEPDRSAIQDSLARWDMEVKALSLDTLAGCTVRVN